METYLFKIQVITNLHAGSGDASFGIVDKLVQRDTATRLPTIYGSGIKGALKEYCRYKEKTWIQEIFGDADNGQNGAKPGMVQFLAADLLALPVPHTQSPFYRLAWDTGHIQKLTQKYQLLRPGFNLGALMGQGYATMATEFAEAIEDLPVIARNHLENGISQNLWYEEVVPHQSEFIFGMQANKDLTTESLTDFITTIDNQLIQVGGNATVGYGLCNFSQIKTT